MNHQLTHSKCLSTWKIMLMAFLMISFLGCGQKADIVDSHNVKAIFAHPPRQYSTGPLWVWNDMLTEEQIKTSMAELAGQGVKQVWVHPRPGLMTPYLGDEWFRLWEITLEEAERLDMNVWIYDENSYPSGFAGGLVPEAMPESRGRGIHFSETAQVGELDQNIVAVYRLNEAGFENITSKIQAGQVFAKGQYLTAALRFTEEEGWYGGKYYVDLLHPGVTDKFIDITMEAYRNRFGDQFGKRIPGWFTDEPHLTPAGGIHWSERFPVDFKRRWGYDILNHLPSLVRPVGDWKRIRHNYQQFLLEEFINCWAKPCYDYCEKHGLDFTGHYWEHGWPYASHGGDNMAMSAWQQRPGIDILMNEYSEDTHAQFGNARAVKELSSVANQLGRKRTLCETYGAGGWDLRFEDMKRIGDWIYVLGVNTLNEHLTYVTIRGARKRDHPQSFSYHEPWWEAYHKLTGYFTRLSAAMSAGDQINTMLLLEPTTTAWMYQPDKSGSDQVDAVGASFQDMVNKLESAQAEYDIGCEDIISRHARVEKSRSNGQARTWFVVGQRMYGTVVLPPYTENLNSRTMDLLEEFLDAGGEVVSCAEPPARVDGQVSDRGGNAAQHSGWKQLSKDEAVARIRNSGAEDFSIHRSPNDRGILFHHRRRLKDGEILFLVNTSIDHSSSGVIRTSSCGVEKWGLETGEISPYPFVVNEKKVEFEFFLPPSGSQLLFLSDEPMEQAAKKPVSTTIIQPEGTPAVRRVEHNVLTIDYVDVAAGNETKENIYFYEAQEFVFQKNGMEGNPWHRAVQFRDELITITFPPGSGFEAVYRFNIKDGVPEALWIVIERPDLYEVTCNGKSVDSRSDDWWLDRSFGKMDISHVIQKGSNTVTIKASPMTIYHELEPAYILGDFYLEPGEKGFHIIPSKPLVFSNDLSWKQQGHPFYAAGMAYGEKFDVAEQKGRYMVSLTNWYGSVAKVSVNGEIAGYIGFPPWECDVTEWMEQGVNDIEVTIIGTLKNTLGPHHVGPVSGRAWPNMFTQGPEIGPPPGNDYHTLDYGLFQPFVLKQIIE